MNYLWGFMIIIGVVYGALSGNMADVGEQALSSAKEAVTLCIAMAGVMAFWVGMMEIAQDIGLIRSLSGKLAPVLSFLFPNLPKGHSARSYIATNIIANVFGLGWAATPAGLNAMKELANLEEQRGTPGYSEKKEMAENSGAKAAAGIGRRGMQGGSDAVDREKGRSERAASREMCTFLILNISSLQLIPVNIIAYRQQYGSVNPAGIVAPAIVATAVSTTVAVIYCKVMDHALKG